MVAQRRFIRLLCFLCAAVVAADIHATAHFAHTAQSSVSTVKRSGHGSGARPSYGYNKGRVSFPVD